MASIRVWQPGAGLRRVTVLPQGITLGRSGGDATVQIDGDPRLSRRHGRVWSDGNGLWYEDLGSSFGSYVDAKRLSAPVQLKPGLFVVLSDTLLSADDAVPAVERPLLPQGMTLRMEAHPGADGLVGVLGQASPLYAAVLYDIVNRLLLSSSVELISDAVGRIRQVVPAAQRIVLVGWPPAADGRFDSLVPGPAPTMSTSLARYAVEHRRALWLSGDPPPADLQAGPSVQMMGILSAVYVPLLDPSGAVLGLLGADSTTPTLPLTAEHFQFLCAIGGLLASALAMERLRRFALDRQLEAESVRARREALVAFLQMGSHDLKNQLTAIQNTAMFLQDVQPPEQQRKLLSMLLKASRRAIDLIATYLDVAQIEADHPLDVTWSSVKPHALVDQEIALLRLAFPDRVENLVFDNAVQRDAVRTDEPKLRQIVSNLIGNAILYSPAGGRIRVTTATLGDGLRFEVHDQGVGIAPDDQKRLFAAFSRVGSSPAPGHGLGLWLSATLVAALGGRIGVESEPGQGSTFWFTLLQPDHS